jgi:hypothetical protein
MALLVFGLIMLTKHVERCAERGQGSADLVRPLQGERLNRNANVSGNTR